MTDINDFLYPRNRYRFNANLQEFAQRVTYIANLETAGKLSPEDAYQQIEALWERLKHLEKYWIATE